MSKVQIFITKHIKLVYLFILLGLTLTTRIWSLIYRLVPFGFDHGKDSIAILSMLVTYSPKLIGPWTSIPGVFFGPGWYYLLAPAYLVSQGDPSSAVWVMIILSFIQSVLVWKVWGVRAAILVTLAPLYIITSKSAWNPFPMTLISFGLLAVLWIVARKSRISNTTALGLGFIAGLGFHFSAAFSIFYVPYVLLTPWLFTLKNKIHRTLVIAVGVFLSFIPQLLFEIRHSFVQTNALLGYFAKGEPHAFTFDKVKQVISTIGQELSLGIFPGFNEQYPLFRYFNQLLLVGLLVLFSILFIRWWKLSKSWQKKWVLFSVLFLLIIPIFGYLFLHFNVWYVYGMAPTVTLLASFGLTRASKKISIAVLSLFIFAAAWNTYVYVFYEVPLHNQFSSVLATKEKVINFIVENAGTEPFSVYTYAPDIYDFSYQYLWFRRAYQGKKLPVDFSYKPYTNDYITDKPALLSRLPVQLGPARKIYYIIEKPSSAALFEEWWALQNMGEVLERKSIGDQIEVVVTIPKS